MAVSGKSIVAPGECRYQHQQGRLRQMEVCEQRFHNTEAISGRDKDAGRSRVRTKSPISAGGSAMLTRAHGCGSRSYNSATASFRFIDLFRAFRADFVPFAMQLDLSR